jgi:hypothetical protein
MNLQEKRKQLKRYFYKLRLKKPGITFAVAALFYYIVIGGQFSGLSRLALVVMLISFGLIIYQLVQYYSAPSDVLVDQWLQEDIDKLVNQSYQKLGLEKSESMPDPLVIISPVYWQIRGIDVKDLGLRKGKDKMLRFSVYQITIFQLHDYVLASYICYYNFRRSTSLNETTHEYHYRDIVSVSTQEVSSNYYLPDGQKLVHVQEFKLSVASGESIKVTINPYQIAKTENAQLPPTGAERAVSVLRNMLREKKV